MGHPEWLIIIVVVVGFMVFFSTTKNKCIFTYVFCDYKLGCPIFASKRNEAKQKPFRSLFASFRKFFTLFRFFSLQFFRFVSLQFLEGSKDDTENRK